MIRFFVVLGLITSAAMSHAQSPATVVFDRDVRPILARHCLKCHGQEAAEGGLNLGDRDAATRELDSGQRALVPNSLETSELWRRVTSDDAAKRMPPDVAPLAEAEQEVLRRWIVSGAEWSAHWSYRRLTRPDVPLPQRGGLRQGCRNPVDCFSASHVEDHNLCPAPPDR